MRYCVLLFVSLLTIVGVGVASGEWTYRERRNAKPQAFTVDENYVIAVGTVDKLEEVKAEQIKAALLAGKEIR